MTSSKNYFGENGKAKPATRLIAIKPKPSKRIPLRGFNSARISGRAFQVSAADFFGLPAAPTAPTAGAATREWVLSPPMRVVGLPGSLGTMFFRCVETSYDYTP